MGQRSGQLCGPGSAEMCQAELSTQGRGSAPMWRATSRHIHYCVWTCQSMFWNQNLHEHEFVVTPRKRFSEPPAFLWEFSIIVQPHPNTDYAYSAPQQANMLLAVKL